MKELAQGIVVGFVFAGAMFYTGTDSYETELAMEQERNCIAIKKGERSVSERRRDGSVTCVRYENAEYMMAPRLVSAEAWRK